MGHQSVTTKGRLVSGYFAQSGYPSQENLAIETTFFCLLEIFVLTSFHALKSLPFGVVKSKGFVHTCVYVGQDINSFERQNKIPHRGLAKAALHPVFRPPLPHLARDRIANCLP